MTNYALFIHFSGKTAALETRLAFDNRTYLGLDFSRDHQTKGFSGATLGLGQADSGFDSGTSYENVDATKSAALKPGDFYENVEENGQAYYQNVKSPNGENPPNPRNSNLAPKSSAAALPDESYENVESQPEYQNMAFNSALFKPSSPSEVKSKANKHPLVVSLTRV